MEVNCENPHWEIFIYIYIYIAREGVTFRSQLYYQRFQTGDAALIRYSKDTNNLSVFKTFQDFRTKNEKTTESESVHGLEEKLLLV